MSVDQNQLFYAQCKYRNIPNTEMLHKTTNVFYSPLKVQGYDAAETPTFPHFLLHSFFRHCLNVAMLFLGLMAL